MQPTATPSWRRKQPSSPTEIAEGQHFIEGNKRTALAAMLTFLRVNGHDIKATQEERAAWILGLASGGSADDLAVALRLVITPLPKR